MVASQGKRDRDALHFALATGSSYVALVASRKKAEKLRRDLNGAGIDPGVISRIRSPSGVAIGAVTPEEIALSVLAEIVRERRLGTADGDTKHVPHVTPGGINSSTKNNLSAPVTDSD